MKKRGLPIAAIVLIFIFLIGSFSGYAQADDLSISPSLAAAETSSADDDLAMRYAGKKIGVLTGSVYDLVAAEHLPYSDTVSFNTISDLGLALNIGKIDAYIVDTSLVSRLTSEYSDQKVEQVLAREEYGFIFAKDNNTLCNQFNEFLKNLRESGTMREVMQAWFGTGTTNRTVNLPKPQGENGVLSLAVSTDVGEPFVYLQDDNYVGFDVELAARFCREYGYGLEIVDSNFTGMLASVSGGRCDFGASSIIISDERKEVFLFSDSYFTGSTSLVARETKTESTDYEALRGIRIGVIFGAFFDELSKQLIPDCEIEYFYSNADMARALEDGEIDAYMADEPVARIQMGSYPDQRTYRIVTRDSYGFAFPKDDENSDRIRGQMNKMLQSLRENGALNEIDGIWFGDDDSLKVVDYSGLTGENGTLRMAISSAIGEPFCYIKDGQYAGYDIDIAVRFCREYGYAIEFEDGSFNDMLVAISSGQCDFGASCITITEDRKKSMNFSDLHYYGGVVIVVRDESMVILQTLSDASVYETLSGRAIGVQTGTIFVDMAKQIAPDCEVVQFNTIADLGLALEADKIDGYMCDEPSARLLVAGYAEHQLFAMVSRDEYAYLFPKNSEWGDFLREQMNEFLAEIRADGTMQKIDDIWLGDDPSVQIIDYSELTDVNGTVTYVGSSGIGAPFFYMKDGQYVGYDIDIVARFCKEYGYALEIMDVDFSGLIACVATGRADFGGSSVTITEERKESVNFSDPNYYGGVVIVTKNNFAAEGTAVSNFFSPIKDSFVKTFIRENRWQLFLSGIGVTLLITVISALCGTVVAFLLFLLFRRGYSVANAIISVFSDIMLKTPVVVILMILYYIIFVHSSLDGLWVSCIGFTMIFACSVINVFRVAVDAVDHGQTESTLALGYSDTKAFLRIVLPQAMEHFLPIYKGEIVTLIKSTAIVGYIAVQDLTKVSDIIRSRTYDAFFPLIASAVIYFALAWLLALVISGIQIHRDPHNRHESRILKGINTASDRKLSPSAKIGEKDRSGRESRVVIEFRHLRKEFQEAVPIADVNAFIRHGDVISVIGPSGTGKSTLLRCINRLNTPTSGQILVNGADITAPDCRINEIRQKVGMVFQNYSLFGHLTVIENVMLAPTDLLGLSRQEAYDRGMELLRMVGMNGRALEYPDMLSGGQKQRVAIARALAMDPEIILFDEPTSALDPTMVGEVQAVIRELAHTGKTMMIVTHEMQFARIISNRVFYMDQGGIYEDGTPEQIFDHPEKERTRRFVHKLKVFEVKIEDSTHDFHGTVSSLERYGYKSRIPSRILYRIQAVFEELCQQILLPRFEVPQISFTVEYDVRSNEAKVTITYGGEAFDPCQTDNQLSLSILKKVAYSIEYTADYNENVPNIVVICIREQ